MLVFGVFLFILSSIFFILFQSSF